MIKPRIHWFALAAMALSLPAAAQQPFYTDDAEVANYHRWHLEMNNEFDILSKETYPGLRQDTQTTKFSFGAAKNLEIGADFPLLTIYNSAASALSTPFGFGDLDFSAKYKFLEEHKGWLHPAVAASLDVEVPTGDSHNGLGSGVPDYYVNTIAQKSITDKTAFHLNGGIYFAGNTLTGLIGIKQRGILFTSGGSVIHQFTQQLDLGVELVGAMNTQFLLPRGQLQGMVGGNYQINKSLSLDFGAIGGKFSGSPRAGLQLGFSKDF